MLGKSPGKLPGTARQTTSRDLEVKRKVHRDRDIVRSRLPTDSIEVVLIVGHKLDLERIKELDITEA